MNASTITSKIWVGIGIAAACLVVGYFFTNKTFENYSKAQAVLVQSKTSNQQLKDALAMTDEFLANFQAKAKDAQLLNLALPAHSSDMSNFVTNLGSMAQQSGVALSGFQVTEASTKNASNNIIQPVVIRMSAEGSYPSVEDFVLRLERNLRIIDITQITLQADQNA